MATATGQFPRQVNTQADVPAVGTAGNDSVVPVWTCPQAATIQSCTYVPTSTITGAATNNRTFVLVNTGQTGVGTTVVATLNMGAGVNAAADDEKAITLSATPANLDIAAGDVLVWQSTHIGTGITDPGGMVNLAALTN